MESEDKKTKIQIEKLKCALCGGNHTANYSNCPIRKNFKKSSIVKPQASSNFQQSQKSSTFVKNQFTHAPELENFNLPGRFQQQKSQQMPQQKAWTAQNRTHTNQQDDSSPHTSNNDLNSTLIEMLNKISKQNEQLIALMTIFMNHCMRQEMPSFLS